MRDKIISIVFVFLLLLPLAVSILEEDKTISRDEKRRLSSFPKFSFGLDSLEKFPKKFEKYFEDHFGLRDAIIRTYNYTAWKVFRVSPSDFVIVGHNGWYFFNANGSVYDYMGIHHYNELTKKKVTSVLNNRKTWLNAIGAKYIFLPAPNKEMVYDEFLPFGIRIHKGKSKYDQIVNYLKAHHFKNVIDTKTLMINKKGEGELFHKTDSHWNDNGVYQVYLEIIKKMQPWFPEMEPIEKGKKAKWVDNFSGDLTMLMNLRGRVTERASVRNFKSVCKKIQKRSMLEVNRLPGLRSLPTRSLPIEYRCNQNQRTAIIIHDSFGLALLPYLEQHFGRLISIRFMNFEVAKPFIANVKPDIVIDLRVARNIEKALRPDPELEQWVLLKKFDLLEKTLLYVDALNIEAYIHKHNGIALSRKKRNVLSFKKKNAAISLDLDLNQQVNNPANIKLAIESAQMGVLSFCYQPQNLGVAFKQCQHRNVTSGNNTIFLRIHQTAPQGVFTISSKNPGKYILKELIVKIEDS